MELSRFWSLVKDCRWSEDYSYPRIKKFLMKTLTKEEVAQFSAYFSKVNDEVYKIMDAHDKYLKKTEGHGYGLGDDSFGDLCSEVIGRGESFFNSVKKDPAIAATMARNRDYRESFSYGIPWESDYRYLEADYYIKRVENELEQINEEKWSKYNNEINDTISKYKTILEEAVDKKDFSVILNYRNELQTLSSFIKKEAEWNNFGGVNNAINDYEIFYLNQ
jgi:hypothetical protein